MNEKAPQLSALTQAMRGTPTRPKQELPPYATSPFNITAPRPMMSNTEWADILSKVGGQRRRNLQQEFWYIFARRILKAESFDFGLVPSNRIKEEAKRGGDLLGKGLLDLPYETVIYTYALDTEEVARLNADKVLPIDRFRRVTMATREMSLDGGQLHAALDFIVTHQPGAPKDRAWMYTFAGGIMFKIRELGWKGLVVDDPMGRDKKYDTGGAIGFIADGVASLSMMLATKGLETERREPAEKIQQKRASKKKPPLPTVTYVKTQRYYEAIRNSESKGTHASPVPHLRRGHIRHLADGRDTWVRDCLVNCKSVEDMQNRDHYEVE